jgi:exoribonuclease R
MSWIGGILELSSPLRYGITTRGVPIYRFVPYDRTLGPFAVGCSHRDLLRNVHAIVARDSGVDDPCKEIPRATLVQLLGTPTKESETNILLTAYAYDSKKELRKHLTLEDTNANPRQRQRVDGFTFHIDPPGCRDVDDTFTFFRSSDTWTISINIADVSAYVEEGSALDRFIKQKATSFYSPTGEVLAPMLPPQLEQVASLLPGEDKLTLSLQFDWQGEEISEIKAVRWIPSITNTTASYTYDEASLHGSTQREEFQILAKLSKSEDSHKWVETLMIFYNTKAGELLKERGEGILRSHSTPKMDKLTAWTSIDPELAFLAYEAASYVHAKEESFHYGLGASSYAYASSPIRRYCDLVNQRAIHKLSPHIDESLIEHLNRRQKQAKAFSRDLFFMAQLKGDSVRGTVVAIKEDSFKVYVPVWKRVVRVKTIQKVPAVKTEVSLRWHDDMKKAFWKERIVFSFDLYKNMRIC